MTLNIHRSDNQISRFFVVLNFSQSICRSVSMFLVFRLANIAVFQPTNQTTVAAVGYVAHKEFCYPVSTCCSLFSLCSSNE